jgi:hypothetical protein
MSRNLTKISYCDISKLSRKRRVFFEESPLKTILEVKGKWNG